METPKCRVLYLSYDGLGDHIGQSQILPYLLKCSGHGIDLEVLTFERKSDSDVLRDTQAKMAERGIRWHRLKYSVGRNVLLKCYDLVRFTAAALWITLCRRCRILHGRSYVPSAVALLSHFLFGAKVIFDKRDFWIDAIIEVGRLQPRSSLLHKLVYHGLRYCESLLFRRSAHIISLTQKAKGIVLELYPSRTSDDITVIPCCVDRELFDPARIEPARVIARRSELGLRGSRVLGYVGSIDPAYRTGDLIECFKAVRARIPDAMLLFVVNNGRDVIYALADEKGVPSEAIVVITSPRQEMPLSISLFDVGIYFLTPTYAKQAASPTKFAETLAMQRLVVTNKGVGDVEEIFSEQQCGYLVSDFRPEEYERVADWLQNDAAGRRDYDLTRFSLDYGAAKYMQVYRKLCGAQLEAWMDTPSSARR
jgi:glycosyltransferase involved in cell wall biosynthesis